MFLHSDIYLILAPNLFYLKILSPLLCFKFLILDEHVNKNYKSLKYPSHHFRVFLPNHFFCLFVFFFEGATVEMQPHCFLCYSCLRALYGVY